MTHIGPKDLALVNGAYHYVDTDPRGFPVIGVVRHGARGLLNRYGRDRTHGARGLRVPRLTRSAAVGPQTDAGSSTPRVPMHVPADTARAIQRAVRAIASGLPQAGPPPKREPWWKRALLAILAFLSAYIRVSDPEWHETVRNTMKTVLITSFVITAVLVLGKVAWEVLSL